MRIFTLFIVIGSTLFAANDTPIEDWARRTLAPLATLDIVDGTADLAALERFVGDAPVFGFGESHHGLSQPNQARNRFFAHLVKAKGFRAIVLESGFLEGHLVDRYVQGEPGLSLEEVLKRGFTHGMGVYPESRELVEWMRAYNEKNAEKVHFYGLDLSIQGDSPIIALDILRPYLLRIDPEYATGPFAALRELAREASTITQLVEAAYAKMGKDHIEPDLLDCFTTISFEAMPSEKQAALEEGIRQLLARLSARTDSVPELEWHSQVAVQASQMVRNLRSRQKYPKIVGFEKAVGLLAKAFPELFASLKIDLNHIPATSGAAGVEDLKSYFKGRETRELSEAENVEWIQKRHGKVMVFAQNGHLMTTLVDIWVGDMHVGKNGAFSAGDFIRQRYGKSYAFMASTVNQVVDRETGVELTEFNGIPLVLTPNCADCLERPLVAAAGGAPYFFVDLRTATGEVLAELERDRENRFDFLGFQRFNTREGYDGLLLIDRATLAVKLTFP